MGDYSLNLNSIEFLETQLQQILQPVEPRPAFIDRLEKRLTVSTPTILDHRPELKAYYILIFGLVLGVLSFWIFRLLIPRKE